MLYQRRTGSTRRGITKSLPPSGSACVGCRPVHDRCLAVAAQMKRIFVLNEVKNRLKGAPGGVR